MKRSDSRLLHHAVVPILLGVAVVMLILPAAATEPVLRPARATVLTVAAPFELLLVGIGRQIASIPRALRSSQSIAREQASLTARVEELEAEKQGLLRRIQRNEQLIGMLTDLRQVLPRDGYETLTTEVIARPVPIVTGGAGGRSITVQLGRDQGVTPGDVVVAGPAVVGTIFAVGLATSEVRLITHPDSRIPGQIFPNGSPGILSGESVDTCLFNYVPSREHVKKGDVVVTSGGQGKYPRGLYLGMVTKSEQTWGDHLRITVRPGVDFNKLDQVIVVRRRGPS